MKLKFQVVFFIVFILLSIDSYSQNNYKSQNISGIEDSLYLLDMGRFQLPIKYDGVLADVYVNNISGGRYDDKGVIYSAGFYISGKKNMKVWAAGNASASRVQDFLPGKINETTGNPENKFYYINESEPHFGMSWQNWKKAVERGASFYDGNKDGVYNPVDLNGNSTWDLNEDKPDIFGRTSVFTVFNDGVNPKFRRFPGMAQIGIEIGQMIGGYALSDNINSDIILIKYTLKNTGLLATELDSVIFSIWLDPDLGDPNDDLVSTDLFHNSIYVYNDGIDSDYGSNPPALGVTFLQGPIVFIPGVTFTDVNNNGVYDEGTDISLKEALKLVSVGDMDTIKGAMNQKLFTTNHYLQSDPFHGDPNTAIELRNYQDGLNRVGEKINPCTWPLGTVLGGINCNSVDPSFVYSGDPVNSIGWLNNTPTDQRIMSSIGPFKLEAGKPVDIILAYTVGRGNSSLNSIEILRNTFQQSKRIYEQQFPQIVGVKDETLSPLEFVLEQNYPNPFNPETKIRFQLNKTEAVKLSVFNVLGQEIKTLVNEELNSGVHEVTFNGTDLASGLYFYQLQAGENSTIKKMILVK